MDQDTEFEDEHKDNSIKIEYYPYPADIKYKLEIDNNFHKVGSISFHHGGNLITSRNLSKFEIKSLLASLKILQIPLFYDDNFDIKPCPCITSKLVIKTPILKTEFKWDNGDEEDRANELLSTLVFKDLIESLIEVDFSILEMPRYQ
jgi:hypothetical protein